MIMLHFIPALFNIEANILPLYRAYFSGFRYGGYDNSCDVAGYVRR